MMLEYISLKKIGAELGYRKTASVKRWCRANGVGILRDPGSKIFYAIRAEFEQARMKSARHYLKEKYGKHFPDVLNAYLNFRSEYERAVAEQSQIARSPKESRKALGAAGERFKTDLLVFLNEL